MERRVSEAFGQVLAAGRERYNALFAEARRVDRNLSPEAFLDHLAVGVDPIIAGVGSPEKREEIVDTLYLLSLELFRHGALGEKRRYPVIGEAWRHLLPKIPGLLAEAPREVAFGISNALYNMAQETEGGDARWLAIMIAVAGECGDVDTFLAAGQVAAWRCGMAHYREGALEVARKVPWPVFGRIFGLKPPVRKKVLLAVMERLSAHRWYSPRHKTLPEEKRVGIVATPGGFRGFGGPFMAPPKVTVCDGTLCLFDGKDDWVLHADTFGATLHRTGKAPTPQKKPSAPAFSISRSGVVRFKGGEMRFANLAAPSSQASTEDTLAVCLPHSHRVFLIGDRLGGK